jgi:hypothetical protein
VTSPRFSREAFAPPEPSFEDSNGNGPHEPPNGDSPEFVDETRPRASFGVPGTGPAGGFEAHPFAPPAGQPVPESMPSDDHGDGFSQPTLAGGGMPPASGGAGPAEQAGYPEPSPYGAPPTGDPSPGYGGPSSDYAGPPTEYAGPPTDYAGPPTEFAGPPTDYAGPPSGFADAPTGFGDQPPSSFDSRSGGFGEPTMGGAGPGLAPPPQPPLGQPAGMGGPSGVGVPVSSASRGRPQQRAAARGPRRAKLQLRHINPWTVLKFSCVLSVALFFVWLITIGLLYGILQAAGVIDSINNAVTTINGDGSKNAVTPGLVFGGSAIIGVINVILFIALSTVGSVVYNLCADLVGGIEVTLSERE